MVQSDELKISYGQAMVFSKSKFIGVFKNKEKYIKVCEFNINNEIELLNTSNVNCDCEYINYIENALDEKVEFIFPIITSIKYSNTLEIHNELYDEYSKKHFLKIRYECAGYNIKEISYIKEYIDKCIDSRNTTEFDKVTLKVMLTTCFGRKLSEFMGMVSESSKIVDSKKQRYEVFKKEINNNVIVKISYKDFDFKKLLISLMVWKHNECNWQGSFTDLLCLLDKEGFRHTIDENDNLESYIVDFLKGKGYLYFTFASSNRDGTIKTLDNDRYFYNSKDGMFHKVLSSKCNHIYDPIPINKSNIVLNSDDELGFILNYENDELHIATAIYNSNIQRVVINEELIEFKPIMIKSLYKYVDMI